MSTLLSQLSKVQQLPFLGRLSPNQEELLTSEHLAGFKRAQALALRGAEEVAALLNEGWTEKQAAAMLESWLADHGVEQFFHRAYAWFGDRTRFDGFHPQNYGAFRPTSRMLRAGDVVILDVAPIVDGYTCDIGYTTSLGDHPELLKARALLREIKTSIINWVEQGQPLWSCVDHMISDAGFENIHRLYPMSVLGHRLHRGLASAPQLNVLHFGWQSYWSLFSRGLFGQLLTPDFAGDLNGLWAIEPHIGWKGAGAKFEEILVIDQGRASWLGDSEHAV